MRSGWVGGGGNGYSSNSEQILTHPLFDEANKALLDRFWKFHQANPAVYSQFAKHALEMLSRSRTKYSAVTIIHHIRWNRDFRTHGDVFEINNDFIALYSRMFMAERPEHQDFFEIRTMKTYDRRESGEERYRK